MSIFPDLDISYQYSITPQFKTIKLAQNDLNFQQRRRKTLTPIHKFTLKLNNINAAAVQTLYDFFVARSGSYEPFVYFCQDPQRIYSPTIGTGNDSTTVFDLGAKSTAGLVIKVNGVTKTLTTDYTVSADTGTNGQDKITFGVAPTAGQAITASYTGRKYYPACIFESDSLDINNFDYKMYSTGLVILEVV